MQKRYVVIESKTHGDQFEEVLPQETTEEEAIDKAYITWRELAPSDQQKTTVELAELAYDEETGELVLESKDCPDGWDCLSSYDWICRFRVHA